MFDFSEVFAWIAMGAGAGIVGNLWHARRDAAGVTAKLVVGPAGAVFGGALGGLLFPYGRAGMRLFDAAVFGLVALGLLHLVWMIAQTRRNAADVNLADDPPGNKILAPSSPRGGAAPHASQASHAPASR
jgi:hypothetical protein